MGVGEQGPVDDVGESAFEESEGFSFGGSGGEAFLDEGLIWAAWEEHRRAIQRIGFILDVPVGVGRTLVRPAPGPDRATTRLTQILYARNADGR